LLDTCKHLFNPAIGDDDPIREWRLNTFYRLLMIITFFVYIPHTIIYGVFHWSLLTVTQILLIGFNGIIFTMTFKKKLNWALNLFLFSSTASVAVFLWVTHINDSSYCFPLLLFITGLFTKWKLIFSWSAIMTALLVFIGILHPDLSVLPTTIYSSAPVGHPIILTTGTHFSTAIALIWSSAVILALLSIYVNKLLVDISQRSSKLEKEIHNKNTIEKQVKQLNIELEQRVINRTKELQESQEKLYQNEKLRVIGQLAGGIAHDFNNHLTGILGCAQILKSEYKNDKEKMELIDVVISASRRASELTAELLAFARKGTMQKQPIDMHQQIKETIILLQRSIDKKITISHQLNSPRTMILGDPSQIHNALLNFGLNARDAMPEGGTLLFSTIERAIDSHTINTENLGLVPGNYIQVKISDTGQGIDPELIDRIFEPFFTTKKNGQNTGMGLAAIYGTMKSHGGTVKVTSKKGKGTDFYLYFPVADHIIQLEQENENINAQVDTAKVTGKKNIVIIDDEQFVRKTLSSFITKFGFEPILFSNGPDAIAYFKKYSDKIDCVLLDMIMPEMDGTEVFDALQRIYPQVKIILCSGYSKEANVSALLKKGAKTFLQKPFSPQNVADALNTILAE